MVRTGPDLAGFSKWVRRVLRTLKKENGWGITRVAVEAGVARSTVTLWRDADWSKGIPTRPAVEKFCTNLKLKKDEPFTCMGWTLDLPRGAAAKEELREPEPEPDSEVDRRIALLRVALDRPGIDAAERRDLEIELVRLEAVKRTSEDTVSSADRVLRRYGHGAA